MERAHDDELQRYLEEAHYVGWCVIPDWKLYRWYHVERLGKAAWRDILRRWNELTRDDKTAGPLEVYVEHWGPGYLFIHRPSAKSDRWIVALEELAGNDAE
jgi:hypothetical protein